MTDGRALKRMHAWLTRPLDATSLAVYRFLFGAMMAISLVRFMAHGWVEKIFVDPTFFFKYDGFSWVVVWPRWGLYLHLGVLVILSIFVAVGFLYRASIVLFVVGFAYVQLMDVTNYLNHYYLVVLLGGLMAFMPLDRAWSVRTRRRPADERGAFPAWMLYLLRFQIAVVYAHAALAKVGPDWLLHGQPMGIWLMARDELPVFGPLMSSSWLPLFMSWCGFLYDATIVGWLSWRRTRALAFIAVVVFHVLTKVLFDIGMFPVIMIVSSTLFFDPAWARRWIRRRATSPAQASPPGSRFRVGLAVASAYCAFQLFFPLRSLMHEGDVLFNELGMRYSWKVMVREKNGSLTYRARDRRTGRVWDVSPYSYLTWRQANEMSGQPDLILALGKHIAGDLERKGLHVEMFADTSVSLNGRPAAPMVDPDVDLLRIGHDLTMQDWLLPAPSTPPLPVGGRVASR